MYLRNLRVLGDRILVQIVAKVGVVLVTMRVDGRVLSHPSCQVGAGRLPPPPSHPAGLQFSSDRLLCLSMRGSASLPRGGVGPVLYSLYLQLHLIVSSSVPGG